MFLGVSLAEISKCGIMVTWGVSIVGCQPP